jgi:hypothetical protein
LPKGKNMSPTNLNRAAAVSVLALAIVMGLVISNEIKPEKADQPEVAGASILRECPNEWVVNKMPGVVDGVAREEYFVVNGERRETAMFDYAWVMENCDLEPTEVY